MYRRRKVPECSRGIWLITFNLTNQLSSVVKGLRQPHSLVTDDGSSGGLPVMRFCSLLWSSILNLTEARKKLQVFLCASALLCANPRVVEFLQIERDACQGQSAWHQPLQNPICAYKYLVFLGINNSWGCISQLMFGKLKSINAVRFSRVLCANSWVTIRKAIANGLCVPPPSIS